MTSGTSGRMDPVDRTALIAATLPLLVVGAGGNYEQPDIVHFGALVAGIAGLGGALSHKRWAGPLVLLAVLALGVYLRATTGDNRASDVMLTTNEAVGVLRAGADPYAHVYQMTNPPGGLFGYPPGEIVFYLIAQAVGFNLFRVDVMSGILALGVIAALAPLVGDGLAALAIAAVASAADVIFHSADGSNDTAAAFLTLLAVATLAWSLTLRGRPAAAAWCLSAIAFGWVVAFKEYALPIAVFAGLFLWREDPRRARRWSLVAGVTFALFVVPFFAWNPAGFIANVGGALIVHHNIWGRNVWHDVAGFIPGDGGAIAPLIPAIALIAPAVAAVLMWRRRAPSLGAACLQGCALIALAFILARWTTSVYWIYLTLVAPAGVALTLGAERSPQTPPP